VTERLWAGYFYGTNTGKVFVELEGEDNDFTGVLHINDDSFGPVKYSISGSFDGIKIKFEGVVKGYVSENYGNIKCIGEINSKGEIRGKWNSAIGTAGTLTLFPQDNFGQSMNESTTPGSLYTARYVFGAVRLGRDTILELCENIRKELSQAKVIVTVVTGTEQSFYLDDFDQKVGQIKGRVNSIILYCQKAEPQNLNSLIRFEFGLNGNSLMVQGADESWVLGALEKFKLFMVGNTHFYATQYKKFGITINQFLIFAVIIYLPSIENLFSRVTFSITAITLLFIFHWLHNSFVPYSSIQLDGARKENSFIQTTVFSVLIQIMTALILAGLAFIWDGFWAMFTKLLSE
jgi:hypothetical protein